MSHCVPDWDGNGGELDDVLPSNDFSLPVKGKWECFHRKRSQLSDLAFVPTHVDIEPGWTDNDDLAAMQGQGNKGSKTSWQAMNFGNGWSTGQETEDAVTPVKPVNSSSAAKETVLVNEPVVDHQHHVNSMHDDEMVSWLQYPLDDSLERSYCSDFFGELPNSNISGVQLLKESFAAHNQANGRSNRNLGLAGGGNNIMNSRASAADAAMALGAGRAAGLIPQTGVEAFTKVKTTMQPYGGKWSPNITHNNAGKSLGMGPSSEAPSTSRSPPTSGNRSTPMLPPKSQGVNIQSAGTTGRMNFSHFSVPAAAMKANLQSLAVTHGVAPFGPVSNLRLKTPMCNGKPLVDTSTSSGSSIAESAPARQRSGEYRNENDAQVLASEAQHSLGTESSWHSMQDPISSKGADAANSVMDGDNSEPRPDGVDQENRRSCGLTGSAVLGTEKRVSQGAEMQDVPEPTITSSSGGSGNSADRAKEAASSGKRRTREGEESECQSEQDGEDEMNELKKPQQRGPTTKRSRAAEVHNLSERRRRDRINEKMKALQELIPNSNKTDKASMLDEAIEYLKMLQLQLQQMMSMRSGMSIPPMVMPAGIQHLQMGPMPPMGMGMGMGPMGMGPMGLGMSMMDLGGGAASRSMMPLSGPSHSHNVSATSSAVSMVDTHDHRLPTSSVMDPLNVYMAQQHRQMQMSPQPMSMEMYSAYMMHHQQQQQQQQQQQHQLQHQHSMHHLPSSMGGGAPQ